MLILACIIYWQERELERVLEVFQAGSPESSIGLDLLEHISLIGWGNVLLYGNNTPLNEV